MLCQETSTKQAEREGAGLGLRKMEIDCSPTFLRTTQLGKAGGEKHLCCPRQSSARLLKGRNWEQIYYRNSISFREQWFRVISPERRQLLQWPGHNGTAAQALKAYREKVSRGQILVCVDPGVHWTCLCVHTLASCPEGAAQLLGLVAVCLTWRYWEQTSAV